jgi:hypothetical protein
LCVNKNNQGRIIKEDFKVNLSVLMLLYNYVTDTTLSTFLTTKSNKHLQNDQTMNSLRRADRAVLKDFSRNYTLTPQDLTDPSRLKSRIHN